MILYSSKFGDRHYTAVDIVNGVFNVSERVGVSNTQNQNNTFESRLNFQQPAVNIIYMYDYCA